MNGPWIRPHDETTKVCHMSKNISLKDIASRVGVSTALVSYVLNNKKQDRISKEVAGRIREAARALGYRKNYLARSLKTNKTFTIGLLVADISNAYFSNLARVIEDEADRHRYTVIFCSSDEDPEKSAKLIDTLLSRQVDGLIIASAGDSADQVLVLQQQGIPFVLIDRYFPDVPTNYVALDNYDAAFTATSHLLQGGCRKPGFITYSQPLFHMRERARGYLAAVKQEGLTFGDRYIRMVDHDDVEQQVNHAMKELTEDEDPVDGILFASNKTATFGLKYINASTLRVPQDLSIVSFDESDAFELFYAPVTHIRQPIEAMGRKAMEILLDQIATPGEVQQVMMKATFVPGASSVKPVPGQ